MGYRHDIERVEGMARPPYSAARSGGLGSRGAPYPASGGRIRSSASAFVQCFPGRAFIRSMMPIHARQAEVGAMAWPHSMRRVFPAACPPRRVSLPVPDTRRIRSSAPMNGPAPGTLIRSSPGRGSARPSPGLLPRQDTTGPTGPRRGNSWRGRCPVEGTGRASSPVTGRAAIIRRFAGEGTARCRPVTSFCLEGTG